MLLTLLVKFRHNLGNLEIVKMNIFLLDPPKSELNLSKSMKILEITLSLRPRSSRSSTMPASLEMFRHAIIIYSASCIHFRGLQMYTSREPQRDPKSREKVHLKSVVADPAMCTGLTFM